MFFSESDVERSSETLQKSKQAMGYGNPCFLMRSKNTQYLACFVWKSFSVVHNVEMYRVDDHFSQFRYCKSNGKGTMAGIRCMLMSKIPVSVVFERRPRKNINWAEHKNSSAFLDSSSRCCRRVMHVLLLVEKEKTTEDGASRSYERSVRSIRGT